MKNCLHFFFLLYFLTPALTQTPVFTFECFCGYVKPSDNNCDICDTRTTSRSFTGLLIRQNGTAFKWIESPYIVKVKGSVAEITELVYPNPEKVFIEIRSTYCDSMPILLDSISCPCKPPPLTLIAGPGISISGDTISAIDTSYTNELQTLDTFLRVGDTIKISLTLDDTTYFLLLPPGAAPQFIDTLQIVGNIFGISISGDGVPLKTLDLSQFMQTLSWTQSTGALSISGGNAVTILAMVGATVSVNGEQGLVPKPLAGDQAKFLRGDGTWANPSVGGDNWGSQVVQHGTTLTGDGTGALPLDVATDGITATHIAAGAVGTSEVADNSLTATDLAVNVVSSVDGVTNDGGNIDLIAGGIVTITPNDAANTITISATEVDGSTSNELQTFGHAGTTSYTNTLSNGGGSFTLQASGIAAISHTGGTVTITAAEVDGSTSNELQTISAAGAGPTFYTIDLSNGGGSVTLSEGTAIDLTRSTNTITITNTGDISASNELQTLSAGGTTSPTVTLSDGGGTITFAAAGIASWGRSGNTLTLTATEVDGSTSNELQTYGHAGTTSYTNTLSAGGGSFTLQGSGIAAISHTGGTVTISATEVDGSTSNELQTVSAGGAGPTSYTIDLSNGGGSVTLAEGSGIDLTRATNTITIANTGDLSTTNELQTYGHAGTTSYTNTLSAGGGSFTLQASGIAAISHSGGTVTISATEVDGSTSNELQTVSAGGAGPTSYTIDLSNGGGSVTLAEGSGIDLTRSTNTITITATSLGVTDLSFTGASSPVTLNSSTGADVTLTAAGIVSLSATTGNVTISATEVDGSTSNELQTFGHAGTTSYTNTLSNGGGSFTLQASGIAAISHTGGTVTISATEVDGSTSNELQTISAAGAGPSSYTIDLSNGGGTVTLAEGSGIDLTRATNTITVANTGDLSNTNELQTYGHAGTTSYTNTLSAGGGSFTLQASGIAAISHTGGTVTISATEVDGSTSNELQTVSAGGAGPTSYTIDLSNGGGTVTLAEGSGIDLTRATNTITVANTGDLSNTNELQTYGHAGTTSYTNTLSNGGGSFSLVAGTNVSLSHSGGTVTINSSAGTVTGAESGTYLSSGKVRLGGNLLTTTIIDQDQQVLEIYDGKRNFSRFNNAMASPLNANVFRGLGASPKTTSVEDAVIVVQAQNLSASTVWAPTVAIGIDTVTAKAWLQVRDISIPATEYPLQINPHGGAIAVGRLTPPSAHFTVTATALTGSTATGRVMLLENLEGNGTVGCGYGTGGNNLEAETTWRQGDDAFRITNRSATNGISSVRIAIGGEQDDRALFVRSSATSLIRAGFGYTAPSSLHSTVQSAGSLATAVLETLGAPTFDETKHTVIYIGTTNVTWNLPTASTCSGRQYLLHHNTSSGTITLNVNVSKGAGGTFNTISPGQFAYVVSTGAGWVGYKIASL